jgi:gliding motility-associated-like protein
MKKIVLILFLIPSFSFGQILVDQSLTIQQYVTDVLLGTGVSASNIQFTGCPTQIGHLTGGGSVGLIIDGGVVLSSDNAKNLELAAQSADSYLGVDGCTGISQQSGDLETIANTVPALIGQSFTVNTVNDVAILEFDFVPTGDTLQFNYIFGSDEYLTWINTGYNDIFAFFLSGPGITGPYAAPPGFPNGAINIAQVPNSNPPLPITISSVNPNINAAYYINNPNHDNIDINGYTTTLTAFHLVQCGQTYHIKLAIGDGNDTALESFVMLEEGSFTSNAVVDVSLAINVGQPDVNIIYEDCGEASIIFERAPISDPTVQDMVIVSWSGGGQMGLDYNMMPDTIVFLPGEMVHEYTLDAFDDGLVEGTESVILEILNLAACNGSGITSYFTFDIADHPQPLVVNGYNQTICSGETVTLDPIIEGGYGNYVFDWSTNETNWTIDVTPPLTTTYTLVVSDTCGMPSDGADFIVDVLQVPPLTIYIDSLVPGVNIVNDVLTNSCMNSVSLNAFGAGGDGNLTYTWTDENGNNLWGWGGSLWYDGMWDGDGSVNVTVTDGCGLTATDELTVQFPPVTFSVPDTVYANCVDPITLTPVVTTGGGAYTYEFYDSNGNLLGNALPFTYTYPQATTVVSIVTDNCGAFADDTTQVEMQNPPMIFTLGPDINASCIDNTTINSNVISGTGNVTYQWYSNGQLQNGNSSSISLQSFVTIPVVAIGMDQCGEVGSDTVVVNIPNDPISWTVQNDTAICFYQDVNIWALAQGGEGGFTYYWPELNDYGSEVNTGPMTGSHTFRVQITELCGNVFSDTVHVDVIPVSANFLANEVSDNTYNFQAEPCVDCIYAWDFGDGSTSADSVVTHEFDGIDTHEVQLNVTNSIGCTDEQSYTVIAPAYFFIPSAFTPNYDGINDAFTMVGENVAEFELSIFNRWGEIVFQSNDPKNAWMGDYNGNGSYFVPNGVYSYQMRIKGFDKEAEYRSGNIVVMR